jgi:hypothetical protein
MAEARIIYLTGMKPKPEPDLHRPELVRVLGASLGRIDPAAASWLTARPENFVLVSWTHHLYSERRDIALDLPGIEQLLRQPMPSAADRREADSVRLRLIRLWQLAGGLTPWLSRWLASPAMKVTMADVHRYLDDAGGVGTAIRGQLIEAIREAWGAGDRVLLIGHSLGSVIAYDSLWQLSRESGGGRVALFMTLGSPIATRFVRHGLLGATLAAPARYPSNIDRWVNVAARGDLVCLHRRIRPYFRRMVELGLIRSIEDLPSIYNHYRAGRGLNVHKSYGYLNHPAVAERICRGLR